jgi:dTMP kinase
MNPREEGLPGLFISVDGPGGVGKSTVVDLIARAVDDRAVPVRVTTEPTRTPLGEQIRHGTDTYRGMALACLVAGDRHHHLAAEILPALRAGTVVICDRYLPSSLVLQRLDGITPDTVWQLNAGVYLPDIAVILNADPAVIATRLAARGGHSRFERQPGASQAESDLYQQAASELHDRGWPMLTLDATTARPETIALTVAFQAVNMYLERSNPCPA